MHFALSFLFAVIAHALCPPAIALPETFTAELKENIPYCQGLPEQVLDLALPKGEGPFPAIVFVHGGAWVAGSRKEYEKEINGSDKYNFLKGAAKRGFAAMSVDYRLTRNRVPEFPAHLQDVKCAVRWLKANAAKYKVDKERVGITGFYAGGHLALMAGLTNEENFREADPLFAKENAHVKAIVNWAGITDVVRFPEHTPDFAKLVEAVFGGTLPKAKARWEKASPVYYVKKSSPPMQTLQGTEDKIVPEAQAQILAQKAERVGAKHALILCPGLGHGLDDPSKKSVREDNELVAFHHLLHFFAQHLK